MSDVTIDDGTDPSAAESRGRGFDEKRRTSDKRGRVERISDRLLHVSAHTRRIQDSGAWVEARRRWQGTELRGILVYLLLYCHTA